MIEQSSFALYAIAIFAVLIFLSGIYAIVKNVKTALRNDLDSESNIDFEVQRKTIPQELNEHIEKLYSTFEKYPLKDNFEFESEPRLFDLEALLHRRPLRQMEWDDFGTYPGRALMSFGDVEDFKHFLPRIFELYVSDFDGAQYDLFGLFSRLKDAGFDAWEQEEKRAFLQFLFSWLDDLRAYEASPEDEDSAYGELLAAIDTFEIFEHDKQAHRVH